MDKQTAIKQVEDGFAQLQEAVNGLDDRAISTVMYGEWSIKDILAHIAGWQHESAAMLERMARGERPAPEGTDYSDPDAWNAKFAAAMKPQNASTVLADLQQSFATYIRAARSIPEDRFGEGKTVNRILDGNGSGHYKEHLPAIKEYRSSLTKN
jgi:hypothetical protein